MRPSTLVIWVKDSCCVFLVSMRSILGLSKSGSADRKPLTWPSVRIFGNGARLRQFADDEIAFHDLILAELGDRRLAEIGADHVAGLRVVGAEEGGARHRNVDGDDLDAVLLKTFMTVWPKLLSVWNSMT